MKLPKELQSRYTLFEYTLNGNKVISAIYYLDLLKFLAEYPDAKRVR